MKFKSNFYLVFKIISAANLYASFVKYYTQIIAEYCKTVLSRVFVRCASEIVKYKNTLTKKWQEIQTLLVIKL